MKVDNLVLTFTNLIYTRRLANVIQTHIECINSHTNDTFVSNAVRPQYMQWIVGLCNLTFALYLFKCQILTCDMKTPLVLDSFLIKQLFVLYFYSHLPSEFYKLNEVD